MKKLALVLLLLASSNCFAMKTNGIITVLEKCLKEFKRYNQLKKIELTIKSAHLELKGYEFTIEGSRGTGYKLIEQQRNDLRKVLDEDKKQ